MEVKGPDYNTKTRALIVTLICLSSLSFLRGLFLALTKRVGSLSRKCSLREPVSAFIGEKSFDRVVGYI